MSNENDIDDLAEAINGLVKLLDVIQERLVSIEKRLSWVEYASYTGFSPGEQETPTTTLFMYCKSMDLEIPLNEYDVPYCPNNCEKKSVGECPLLGDGK